MVALSICAAFLAETRSAVHSVVARLPQRCVGHESLHRGIVSPDAPRVAGDEDETRHRGVAIEISAYAIGSMKTDPSARASSKHFTDHSAHAGSTVSTSRSTEKSAR